MVPSHCLRLVLPPFEGTADGAGGGGGDWGTCQEVGDRLLQIG